MSKSGNFIEKMQQMYANPEVEYRPDLRWWLAEGFNTDETLRKNVREIYDNGFGAAEFLAMPEPGVDSSIYGWGSDEWTSDTRLIIEEATKLGLGFSLTSGAHWANANLPDTYSWQGEAFTPDHKAASKELDYAVIRLDGGKTFCGVLPYPLGKRDKNERTDAVHNDIHSSSRNFREQIFQAVVAAKVITPREGFGTEGEYGKGGVVFRGGFREARPDGITPGMLDIGSLVDLTEKVREEDGKYHLDWTAPDDGLYALFVYWMHGTSQTASPSVSTNYTINYIDSYGVEALIDYWEEVVLTEDLKKLIRKNGRGEIYMDSLEISTYGAGGLLWGYNLRDEFRKRKGYDITPYMPLLTSDDIRQPSHYAKHYDYITNDTVRMQKIRNDFYNVYTDMYLENVLAPLQKWLHSLNMTLRAEPSYGAPFEISTPARYIDGIETESFAQVADIDLYRGMAGSAHMYGRLFSSETGAVPRRNYFYNMDEWTQLCYLQFAEGINRTVFHGYSAIEGGEQTYWPGHEGMYAMFSERFNSRQPASKHYPAWTRMLARNQKALRQGVPARDIAVLRTDYYFINYGFPEEYSTFESNYSMHDVPYYFNDMSLQKAGYTYDYFSPQLLEDGENVRWNAKELQPDGPAYRAVIVYQEDIELSSAQRLLEIARSGLPVLFVNNNTEVLAHDGTKTAHKKAASRSKYNSNSDSDITKVIDEIKALPNTAEVDSPAEALAALQKLGVEPRVAFSEPNTKFLTASRRDGDVFYTFVHSYKFRETEPYMCALEIEGEGTPYLINDWTGGVSRAVNYEYRGGRTHVLAALVPGQAMLIAMDMTAKEEPPAADVALEERAVISFDTWDISIEDWNEGERMVNTEEKFGHVTKEVYYTTKKTVHEFKDSPLMPWKNLPKQGMEHVSGIGVYEAVFDWDGSLSDGATLHMESSGGGTVAVWVNGKEAPAVNLRMMVVDISGLLREGENTLRIEVASTLTNRLIQRGYSEKGSNWSGDFPAVQSYGLQGEVLVVPN